MDAVLSSTDTLYLRELLDVADNSDLLALLQRGSPEYGRIERPQFPVRALLRAYLFKRAFRIRHNGDLINCLRASHGLQVACGFHDRIPSTRTFGRFVARLEKHQSLLAWCIGRVTSLLTERLGGPSEHETTPPPFRERELERRYDMNPLPVYSTTAPWPGPDDGDAGRRQRGVAIAAQVKIDRVPLGYKVPSQSGKGSYVVSQGLDYCSCPDYELTQRLCKHIYSVMLTIQREEGYAPECHVPEAPAPEAAIPQATPTRDWAAYNQYQTHEGELFPIFLKQLCDTVEQPPAAIGRPRLDLSDVLLAAGIKTYGTMSVRRSMSSIRRGYGDGLLDSLPSLTSVFRYLEDPAITSVLKRLIGKAAWPLRDVETHFSPDSSGFALRPYGNRWHDHKYKKRKGSSGGEGDDSLWVKCHIMSGAKTNIVTAAAVSSRIDNDSPHLIPFLNATAESFRVLEVSADKAYLSKKNLRAIEAKGAQPLIPFKTNSVPFSPNHAKDQVWMRAYYYYHLHRDEFLALYHQRSNVESTFSSIKAKFGSYLHTRKQEAQVNEVLLRLLCHNICCLIRSMYELSVPITFDEAPILGEQALALAA